MCQDFNEMFNYRINLNSIIIYILIRCKIVEPDVTQYYEINQKFWFYIIV